MPVVLNKKPVARSKIALVDGTSGESVTHAEFDDRIIRLSSWLISQGIEPGDSVCVVLENRIEFVELCLACREAGAYFVPISTHLTASEIAYILNDCGAKVLITSKKMLGLESGVSRVALGSETCKVLIDDVREGWIAYRDTFVTSSEIRPIEKRPVGRELLYSSGTTGYPKGIRRPLRDRAPDGVSDVEFENWNNTIGIALGFDQDVVYLSTGPLYHASPLRFLLRTLQFGGTAVIMRKFDAEAALALIERHQVTHSQWVPTMFTRLLALPNKCKRKYSTSSLKAAIHAAAPCPKDVKLAMLDWWGDVIYEFYAGSEAIGASVIGPRDWRMRPGSVGRAVVGEIHVIDEAGMELPPGEIGTVYFSGVAGVSYHNDPERSRDLYNDRGWATYGDMGHVDADGYLYLSDRRADLIVSGGVNIYPQEVENALARSPRVADVAVIGVPDPDFGEVPKAIVQLSPTQVADRDTAEALLRDCCDELARPKLPRTVVFVEAIPRSESGKLLRRLLKEQYKHAPTVGFTIRPSKVQI